jgi:hypothetical protein
MEDLNQFLNTDKVESVKKVQIVILEQGTNPNTNNIITTLSSKYSMYYHSSHHCLINLIK